LGTPSGVGGNRPSVPPDDFTGDLALPSLEVEYVDAGRSNGER